MSLETKSDVKRVNKLPDDFEIVEDDSIHTNQHQIINRGTGAGVANTNINGLSYEEKQIYHVCIPIVCRAKKKKKEL